MSVGGHCTSRKGARPSTLNIKKTCEERYEFMVDHRSYTVVKLKPEKKKKIQAWTGFEPMTLRYRRSALPTELSSHLGAGHIVSS